VAAPKSPAAKPLREILVEREGKAPLRLVTNDLTRPAAEIAALYKERWQIELLFKWLKLCAKAGIHMHQRWKST
jgi:IS4 transposase